jgi:tetratricopeptide (TPR) repeat protein
MEARRLSPCYAYVQMNLSALASREKRLQESLEWAEEGVRCNPGLALTHYYRGAALERVGRPGDALEAYRRTTEIDAQHTAAWLDQARLLEREQRWSEAAVAYDRASAADPTNADGAMLAGLLYHYRLGDPARAAERYRVVLARNPTHYGAHYQLAVALLASGRADDARAAWRAFVPLAEAIGDRKSLDGAPAELR